MPQETNLNVAPYFDDFDQQSNYYKVLFKPGYPVQARELNNLQSVLQNQVEDVGNHLFKEGAKVIPGQLSYLSNFYAIQIEPEFLGIPVSLYLDQLVGKRIVGETSGVTAQVVKYITDKESERGTWTLYVDYFESATTDLATNTFFDNEVLLIEEAISFTTTFIAAGEGFSKTLTQDASAVGSAFALSQGVYFLRGYFVDVLDQILILDQYSNRPSYRVGLNVTEDIISSDIDPTLTDNAQGFNNYTAPGADRFQIEAILAKKESDDFNDQNFVQLAEVRNGILRKINDSVDYNILGQELARRTFDESGHYYIREFLTTVRESLNNGYGNRGVYTSSQTTWNGNIPSDDLCIYKIAPGKAYIRGYEVDVRGPTFLDIEKPRTTRLIENQAVNFGFGPTISVNRSYGSATIGFNTTNTLSLRSERVGDDQRSAPGKEIGVSRIYDYALESGSYDTSRPDLNKWDLSLFDIQTYTDLTVNENITLNTPVFIQGQSSGASAYLRNSVSVGTALTAYDVQGEFFIGERLKFNGVADNGRTTTDIKNYEISDIKSVYGVVGVAKTFTADLLQTVKSEIGIASISAYSGVCTITTPTTTWPGIVTTGNLIQYAIPGLTDISYAKVDSVNTNSIVVSGVSTITGFVDGGLPSSTTEVTDLAVIESRIQNNRTSGNTSSNNTLYSIFPKKNIQNAVLDGAVIAIRKQFETTITDGATATLSASSNEVFLPFDEERYTLIRSDGSTEALSADKFVFTGGSTQIQIDGLGSDDSSSILIATLRKSYITSKTKVNPIVNSVVINKSSLDGSGIGGTTFNDGLTYGNYAFGTRVQDPVICLNKPDVVTIFGIFESKNTDDPNPPSLTVASSDGPTGTTNDLILGEEIVGTVSGASALYVTRKSDTSISFIYKNNTVFENGEVISFSQSGVNALAANIDMGSPNVTEDYRFSNGQRETIYDYSRIVRKVSSPVATNKLKVYYLNAYYNPADTGDITLVNSYNNFNYSSEISFTDGIRNTDIIDARPRVSDYTPAEGVRSPFEFDGRNFDGGQHSSKYVIASDESISLGYSYYLPRIDRVYLDRDGIFSVKQGAPDDNPTLPEGVSGALNIANISLPAYMFNSHQARVSFIDHKRYQMTDISKLEQRIKNLEYYTSLNQIESSTMNLFVPDANGLNRFKSGVYVDNFSSTQPQDTGVGFRNSIDSTKRVMRPTHYTTSFNLQVGNTNMAGIGTTNAANQDSRYADILGTNVKRGGQVITLDYQEQSWLRQPFVTRSESVTPFLVKFWEGSLNFKPTVDVWIDVNRMELRDVLMEGSFRGVAEAMRAEITTAADGSRSGLSPVIWKAWETTGVDVSFSLDSSQSSETSTSSRQGTFSEGLDFLGPGIVDPADEGNWLGGVPSTFQVAEETTTTNTTISGSVGVDLSQQREGTQTTVTEQIDTESLGDRIVSRNIIHFMRARNIEFTATRMKPYTQVYPFFDNVDVSKFNMPKLIEIKMVSGTFEVGEAVGGLMSSVEQSEQIDEVTKPAIVFRVASTNHKYGPYNNPSDRYDRNPYNREVRIPAEYSETSTILNVDTFSLAAEDSPQFQGFIAKGMILRGVNSGAQAEIRDVRLVTDRIGTLIGSYRVPSSSDPSNPIFETGRSRLRLTSSPIDSKIEGTVTTACEEIFYSQGDIDNTQEVTLSLRNARVTHDDSFRETRTIGDSATASTTFQSGSSSRLTGEYVDPLAQSFMVDDPTGVYLTSVDVYFHEKDKAGVPVTLQLREVELGTPTGKILAYSEVDMSPEDIDVSENASAVTKFKFHAPVYLNGQTEYAVILLSNSTDYRVWISRLGESDISTLATEENQVLVSTQRLLGSLFKSQNASTWTPSQYEDLAFEMFRADFVADGSVQFFNPDLPEDLQAIPKNGITLTPKSIRVGLGTTVADTGLVAGNVITQSGTTGEGTLVGYAGSAHSTLTVTNAGVGYTPSSAYYVFSGVALTSLTGNGIDATAEIAIENGVAIAATISSFGFGGNGGGKGYQIGDVLSPISIGDKTLGAGMKFSVNKLFGNNELIIKDVQGEFGTSAGEYLNYTNSSGVSTTLNYSGGGSVIPESPIRVIDDGLHMKIFQRNHGMHATTNVVTLKSITSDLDPSKLTSAYSNTSTGSIGIGNTLNYANFENVSVGSTNPGYIKISSEIIKYTGVSGNTLTGITRGFDSTPVENHAINDLAYKYELDGISLRRINTTHNLNEVSVPDPITLDTYHVKIDTSDTDLGINRTNTGLFSPLFINTQKTNIGNIAKGTYNVPFEMAIPNFNSMAPTGTNINASIRTTSGKSIDGIEASFVDKGFQKISLNRENYFDSPRIVASKTNEDALLGDLPGNKSLTMNLNLVSEDSRLTPSVDLDQVAVVFVSNRVNSPVSDWVNDYNVKTTTDDPNRCFYVTKTINLENPGTSLQVYLDAYISSYNDVRVFYALNQKNRVNEVIFTPFPGYGNIDNRGDIISTSGSSGLSDTKVAKTDVFTASPGLNLYREHKFTANNLLPFDSFRIKIIGTSTNQAVPPQFRNLRTIALA